ncbi:outer membrane protein OmpA-like peptidoglycan-associated protein [Archangium gephyra]|uniref:Flagellar motor rotation protein MotB n=1 Tax=Archangium gephyra TaxID=48 RepID=A0AAC8QHG9_9BACT|nr:OmpA family protein [Archangium gephyra]AKJ07544.1 Flagellar motor rotation protein MotB [Archangium gephyra]REG19059.1 outer membrane protein OmpA-like peptidoglycan-associated protein [Archangium gephyra]
MRGWKRLTWGVLGAAVFAGCAASTPRELLDARYAYQRASTGPAAQFSPDALVEAREALNEANRAFERERDSENTRTLAYVALRKAQIAESRARAIVAEQERVAAEQQLAMAQASDSVKTRQELERARAELAEAQRLRAEAEQRQSQLQQQQQQEAMAQAEQQKLEQARREEQERQARLDEAQAKMDQLNAQLEQERQARLQAEQRAAQAEAEARAQAQVASDLRNIRQVQVKEEARGLVLTLSGSVLFRSGSADLLPGARRRLDEVAEALKKTQSPLVIEGHTDSQGPTELNEELSYERAGAVRDYLVERGVDSERVRTEGRGEEQPVASNKNAEGRANNRRVEIVIERGIGGAGEQQQPQTQPPPGR